MYYDTPNDVAGFINNPQLFIAQLKQNTTISGVRSTMEEVKKLVDLKKSADFAKCIEVARLHFESLFNHQIANLLSIFPVDAKDKEGQPFWSGPKRAPSPIPYDPSDPLHVTFIVSCANLIAFNLGIPQHRNETEIALRAAQRRGPSFQIKGNQNRAARPTQSRGSQGRSHPRGRRSLI